jgi:hypothetical protein
MTIAVKEVQTAETYDPKADRPGGYDPSVKQKAAAKLSRIPVKVVQGELLKKPDWIRVKAGSPSTRQRHSHLHDHGRQVHAALPVLRCGPWPT